MPSIKLHIRNDNQISDIFIEKLNSIAQTAMNINNNKHDVFINVYICDNAYIAKINKECRGIDKATDVLSFPAIEYKKNSYFNDLIKIPCDCYEIEEKAYFLGDIIISVEKVKEQAEEYMHSFERELCYLFTHGLCHLMGYDHIIEDDKRLMRKMEENILNTTFETNKDILIAKAYEAMKNSYSPYSKFKVGACILSDDGKYYTGCNIENSSYGLANCAERTAIFKAISEGVTKFRAIAIVAEKAAPWPCGACRQVLSEFCGDIPVYISWDYKNHDESTLYKLLPHNFSNESNIQDILGKD